MAKEKRETVDELVRPGSETSLVTSRLGVREEAFLHLAKPFSDLVQATGSILSRVVCSEP